MDAPGDEAHHGQVLDHELFLLGRETFAVLHLHIRADKSFGTSCPVLSNALEPWTEWSLAGGPDRSGSIRWGNR